MFQVDRITKSYGGQMVLSDVSFTLGTGQTAALVGPNGVGKSTLLGIISGLVLPDAGTVSLVPGTRIGFFPQQLRAAGDGTILGYLQLVTGIASAEAALQSATDRLSSGDVSIEAFGDVQSMFEHLGGYTLESRAEAILGGLGAHDIPLNRPLTSLSGGQKSIVGLAGILLRGMDLLLLDEPTNNLDLPALVWLEQFLASSPATCIIVSHDRQFLDRVATKVLSLDADTHALKDFPGTFTAYQVHRAKERERQVQLFLEQQREISRLRTRMLDLKAAGTHASHGGRIRDNDKSARNFKTERSSSKIARRAKHIERRLERMPTLVRPIDHEPLRLSFGENGNEGDFALSIRELRCQRGEFRLGPIDLDVAVGSRVVLLGGVGSGKSTLLQLIAGSLTPDSGTVRALGTIGYYDQEHRQLPEIGTGVDAFMEVTGIDQSRSYRYLKGIGIAEMEFTKPLASFSPGGRARIMLACLMALQPDVLLLDEPTNYLDLEAVSAVEGAVQLYGGTLLVVTHDRRFLEELHPTHLLMMEGGALTPVDTVASYEQRIMRARKVVRGLHSA